jgi:uncharacterized membrane protein
MSDASNDLERKKAALDVVRQLVAQVLTICTSLVAASVGFAKLSTPLKDNLTLFSLVIAAFSIAVVFGLLAFGAIISTLVNSSFDVARSRLVAFFTALELTAFAVGLLLAGWFALRIAGG